MAVELANAYVTLSVETSSISKQVGRMFGGVESQAGKTGRNMGRSMAESFDKAKPDMGRLETDLKRSQDRVVAHKETGSRKMEAANRRVEIAQAKVNEMTAKYGEDSSQALRAQDQLITAQQKAEAETLNYNASLEKLEDQLKSAQAAFDDASTASGKSVGMWERVTTSLSNAGDRMRGVGDRMMGVGQSFKNAGQDISNVGTDLTKLTSPISVAATAAAGLVGVLGFQRLVGIDTAKSQIKGLGYDAEAVMKDVDKGVTDTSLSMAEGAAIARSALATGNVEIGKELEEQITRVANVSAAYGVEGEHAGYLLNNILTKNKVTWGDLSQMQQNQIPIVSQLADYYGVTGDEIQKMAAEGAISIEDLNTVLDDNAGAAAEEYSNSWQGIFANIKANVGKIGAAGLDKFFQVLKDEAGGFLDVLRSDEIKEVAANIGETLGSAFQKLIDGVKTVVTWFAELSPTWQAVILGAIGLAVAIGPILIVVGKLAAGIGAIITTFGMLLKVFALLMNPIGLIITAVGLLVGAFVYLWNTNEGFRDFFINIWEGIKDFFIGMWEGYLQPAFQAIGDAWNATAGFIQSAWENVIQPVWETIATVIQWLWTAVLFVVFAAIWTYWKVMSTAIQAAWEYILKPVWDAVANAATWLWETVLQPVFSWIGTAWQVMLLGMQFYWENVLKPVWNVIAAVATWLWSTILQPVFAFIGDAWSALIAGMKWAWDNVLKPTWDFLAQIIRWLWDSVLSPIFTWIGDKWSSMSDSIRNVYDNFLKPTFDRFGEIVTGLKDKFQTAVDNITKVWETLKGVAAKPIKFVIEKVINDGLISGFNSLIGLIPFMDMEVSKVPVPGWMDGYAVGGYTGDGHWQEPKGIVHGGEFVLNKQSTNRLRDTIGMSGLNHMNQTGRLPGYDSGGLVRPVNGPLTSGFGAGRGRYPHAGVDWAVPIGTAVRAALAGTVLGHQPVGRTGRYVFLAHPGNRNTYYGHLSRPMVSPGQEVAKGQVIGLSGNTGNSTGPHLHFETWTGGKPVNPLSYMGGLPASADGGEGGGWFDPLAPLRALGDKVGGWFTEKFPNGGFMVDAAKQTATGAIDGVIDWLRDKIPFMGDPEDTAKGMGTVSKGPAQAQVRQVASGFGWDSGAEWSALSQLIQKESGWDPKAANPSSSARGLFQKMTSLHGPIESSSGGQANWGLPYIKRTYGSPSKALAFHNRNNWYHTGGLVRDSGGVVPPGSSVIHNWTRDPEWMYTNKQQDTVQAALDVLKDGAGTNVNFYGPTYMRDEDQFAEHYEERARRQRKVSLV